VRRKPKKARRSAQSRSKRRKVPHNSKRASPKSSAQLVNRISGPKSLLTRSEKRRGPRVKIPASEAVNRAAHLRMILDQAGNKLDWSKLLAAQSKQDLETAFEHAIDGYRTMFLSRSELVLRCLKDPKFPKQSRTAQEEFIADSLAGDGRVSIRRSRDICGAARRTEKHQGKILRREFYIECSCGYEGPARFDSCPDCGAKVSYLDFGTGFVFGGYT
jgi:hypothetical protein